MNETGPGTLSNRTFWTCLALLVALGIAVRWPLLWDPATVTPDGAEYLAIARSLRTTGQYATDLKWQFYTADPVRHAAWADRPPLYPAFAALCALALPGLDPTAAARLGNVLLAALAQILAALYLRRVFGPLVALAAAGYTFLLPHTVYWTSQPLTESLTLFLLLAALLLWTHIKAEKAPSPVGSSFPPCQGGIERGLLPTPFMFLAAIGVLCGLTYLTRPTGFLLLGALLLDLLWREKPGPTPEKHPPVSPWLTALPLLAGYLLTVLPYHLMLWKTAGSPFASSLGFTFTITTIHDVTALGFERPAPSLLTFLQEHGSELPALVLRQVASHAQGLLLPLLGLLPFALRVRPADLGGPRRAGFLLVLLLLVTHTLTWSAKGSSRYFLLCLLILAALLLAVAFGDAGASDSRFQVPASRLKDPSPGSVPQSSQSVAKVREGSTPRIRTPEHPNTRTPEHPLTRLLLAATLLGLILELGRFLNTQLRPDHGLPALLAWKAAAARLENTELVASDHPWILNLLAERPAVMLPRTLDPAKLDRFIALYRPDVLILFPNEPTEGAMRDAWRADMLPAGWRVVHDAGDYLEARPIGN